MQQETTQTARWQAGAPERTPRGSLPGKAAFTLLELIAALALLALLMGWFYAGLRGIQRLQAAYDSEGDAVILLNNVLARVEADPVRDEARIQRLFEDEFRKCSLASDARLSPSCTARGTTLTLAVLKKNGRSLAQVELRR